VLQQAPASTCNDKFPGKRMPKINGMRNTSISLGEERPRQQRAGISAPQRAPPTCRAPRSSATCSSSPASSPAAAASAAPSARASSAAASAAAASALASADSRAASLKSYVLW
jgi:hypothetical protein